MAITEEARHRLYQRLGEVLGEEQATTLMEHLPPVGWADVATKHDLQLLRSDHAVLRHELRAEVSELRGDLRAEISEVRTGISELRVEIHKSLQKMMVTMFVSMVSFSAVLVTASHLA